MHSSGRVEDESWFSIILMSGGVTVCSSFIGSGGQFILVTRSRYQNRGLAATTFSQADDCVGRAVDWVGVAHDFLVV